MIFLFGEEIDLLLQYKTQAFEFLVALAPKLVIAVFVLVIGFWLSNLVLKLIKTGFRARKQDPQLISFLGSLIDAALKLGVVFLAAAVLGFETASFVAIFAALGFAVGMALQGNLGNFASGIMVMVFKPYKVDDFVEIVGETGRVTAIEIFNTKLETADGKLVIVPNGMATSDKIINHSADGSIRVDCFFHIPYDTSVNAFEEALKDAVQKESIVMTDPAVSIGIQEFDSHNIKMGVFVYCLPKDYWKTYYLTNRLIKKVMGDQGIQVAYSEGVELGKIDPK